MTTTAASYYGQSTPPSTTPPSTGSSYYGTSSSRPSGVSSSQLQTEVETARHYGLSPEAVYTEYGITDPSRLVSTREGVYQEGQPVSRSTLRAELERTAPWFTPPEDARLTYSRGEIERTQQALAGIQAGEQLVERGGARGVAREQKALGVMGRVIGGNIEAYEKLPPPKTQAELAERERIYERLKGEMEEYQRNVDILHWAQPRLRKVEKERQEKATFDFLMKEYPAVWTTKKGGEKVFHYITKEQAKELPYADKSTLQKYAMGGFGEQTLEDSWGTFTLGLAEEGGRGTKGITEIGIKTTEDFFNYKGYKKDASKEAFIGATWETAKPIILGLSEAFGAVAASAPSAIPFGALEFGTMLRTQKPPEWLKTAGGAAEEQAVGISEKGLLYTAGGLLGGALAFGGLSMLAGTAGVGISRVAGKTPIVKLGKIGGTATRSLKTYMASKEIGPLFKEGVTTPLRSIVTDVTKPWISEAIIRPVKLEYRTELYGLQQAREQMTLKFNRLYLESVKRPYQEPLFKYTKTKLQPIQDFFKPPKGYELYHLKKGIETEIIKPTTLRFENILTKKESFRIAERALRKSGRKTLGYEKPKIITSEAVEEFGYTELFKPSKHADITRYYYGKPTKTAPMLKYSEFKELIKPAKQVFRKIKPTEGYLIKFKTRAGEYASSKVTAIKPSKLTLEKTSITQPRQILSGKDTLYGYEILSEELETFGVTTPSPPPAPTRTDFIELANLPKIGEQARLGLGYGGARVITKGEKIRIPRLLEKKASETWVFSSPDITYTPSTTTTPRVTIFPITKPPEIPPINIQELFSINIRQQENIPKPTTMKTEIEITKPYQSRITRPSEKLEYRTELKQEKKNKREQDKRTSPIIDIKYASDIDLQPKQEQQTLVLTSTATLQKLKLKTKTLQLPRLDTQTIQTPRPPKPKPPEEIKIIIPPPIELKQAENIPKPRTRQAYTVDIKTKGKWKTIATGLPRQKAITAGITTTKKTAARSFKLTKTGKTTLPDLPFPSSLSKYRKPKPKSKLKKGEVYIEKTKYAIDTPGEKKEITLKGIQTIKLKKLWR